MLAVSISAALIGLAMANLFRPGDGLPAEVGRQLLALHTPHFPISLETLVPDLRSANRAVMLMVFISISIGAPCPLLRTPKIGRASYRESECRTVYISGGA